MIGGQPRSREEVWIRLLRSVGQWTLFGYGAWVLRETATGRLVGDIGLIEARRAIDPAIDAPEMGWALATPAQGRGYAKEALDAVLAWSDAHGLARTMCIIDPDNAASIRLAGQDRVSNDRARDGITIARSTCTNAWRAPRQARREDVVILALFLSAAAMTLIVGVRYLVVSGAFAVLTRARHPGLYAGLDPQMRREIGWSLASAAIYGVPAGLLAWGWQHRGWTRVYTDWHAMPLWYLPVSVFAYLALHDTWFYWTHRWMHRPGPVQARACGPSRQPPADRLGGDGVPSDRGADRRGRDPAAGADRPHPCRDAGRRADRDDGHGGDQPYGVGGLSRGSSGRGGSATG